MQQAYAASALTFMFQNLGKPVVFTGSQIPLREPYNDARKNLIMAVIFASSDNVSEVTIFFHDRLIRACRATKINTSKLLAFDCPNVDPLAEIGTSPRFSTDQICIFHEIKSPCHLLLQESTLKKGSTSFNLLQEGRFAYERKWIHDSSPCDLCQGLMIHALFT